MLSLCHHNANSFNSLIELKNQYESLDLNDKINHLSAKKIIYKINKIRNEKLFIHRIQKSFFNAIWYPIILHHYEKYCGDYSESAHYGWFQAQLNSPIIHPEQVTSGNKSNIPVHTKVYLSSDRAPGLHPEFHLRNNNFRLISAKIYSNNIERDQLILAHSIIIGDIYIYDHDSPTIDTSVLTLTGNLDLTDLKNIHNILPPQYIGGNILMPYTPKKTRNKLMKQYPHINFTFKPKR